jgi:hypothetical protein
LRPPLSSSSFPFQFAIRLLFHPPPSFGAAPSAFSPISPIGFHPREKTTKFWTIKTGASFAAATTRSRAASFPFIFLSPPPQIHPKSPIKFISSTQRITNLLVGKPSFTSSNIVLSINGLLKFFNPLENGKEGISQFSLYPPPEIY